MSLSLWLGKLREDAREGAPRILDSHIEAALIELAEAVKEHVQPPASRLSSFTWLCAAVSRLQALAERETSG